MSATQAMIMMEKIQVVIADGQDVIREGLRIVLNHHPDIEVAGVACDGVEAVSVAQRLRPDVVLIDLKMPVLSGIEATQRITQQLPRTRVIILTTYDTDDWVYEGVCAGAWGYLLKESSSEAVAASIRAVQRGESQLDLSIARKMLDAFWRSLPPFVIPQAGDELPVQPLSARESGILELIAQGLSNRQIAVKLSLTEGTVRNYNSKILAKLHAYDRTQAVIKAARRGIVKL